jgi:hypothetical protein
MPQKEAVLALWNGAAPPLFAQLKYFFDTVHFTDPKKG